MASNSKPADLANEDCNAGATPPSPVPVSDTAPLSFPGEGGYERRRLNRLQAVSEVIIATVAVLAACFVAKLPLVVLLLSILLAFMLAPLVDLFQKARLPRSLGALLAVLVLLAVIYGFFLLFYNRALAFAHELPRYQEEIRNILVRVRRTSESIRNATSASGVPPGGPSFPFGLFESNWFQLLSKNVGPITELLVTISFVPFLVYFMLSWQDHVHKASVMLFRLENRHTAYVTLGLISSMIRTFIVGNLLVGLFMGCTSTVVFGLVGLPYFYFLGFISGFLSLVPYLGVVLSIIPPVVAGLGILHSTQFVVVVISVLGLHVFSLNVLYPKFLGSRLQLNPLAVTLALLFWGWLWGGVGLILAIPITAALKIILDHVERMRPYGVWLGE